MASIKVLQTGAAQLEAGLTGAGQSPGWGQTGSEEVLGANDAFPWLTFGKNNNVETVQDNSVYSDAFMDIPRQVQIRVERDLGQYSRFTGLNHFHYWMWGFENPVVKVTAFTCSTVSVDPTAGDTYRDTDLNDFTFLRKEVSNTGTILYIFRNDDSVAPTLQTGDLDLVSGSGDDPITFTAHSGQMYEHLYELDAHERHFVAYRTAEQISGYSAGDKKNRMMTLGIKLDTNDFRYRNAMCRSIGIKSTAGDYMTVDHPFIAFQEQRDDYSSASWTYPATLNSSDNIIAHHQLKVELGASEAALTEFCATDLSLDIAIPLQVLQSTCSGLNIAEPVMQGFYDITLAMTLSRYSAETFQTYRDAWTSIVGRVSASWGYYMQEYLIQETKVPEAGPDDSDVAQEPLSFRPGFTTTNGWATWLTGNTLIQNSPIVFRVRDDNSANTMFSI